jgi:hypothetical protein
MTEEKQKEITHISKEFARGLKIEVKGSGWLIADPLSGYLNFCGHKNVLQELPACEQHPQILIMTFEDGSQFIPAGSDLPFKGATDWLWI